MKEKAMNASTLTTSVRELTEPRGEFHLGGGVRRTGGGAEPLPAAAGEICPVTSFSPVL